VAEESTKALPPAQEAGRHGDLLKAAAESALAPLAALTPNLDFRSIKLDLERYRDMMHATLGPLEELRRSGALDRLIQPSPDLARAIQALNDYQVRFQLPEMPEVTRLFAQFEGANFSSHILKFSEQASQIQRAIEAMRTPWLDVQKPIQSLGGFAELQSIGIALRGLPAFDERLVNELRASLGDWRMAITWPENIFGDALLRTAFYADKGLDLRLTDFPAAAFQQGAALAGLAGEPPPLLDSYSDENNEPDRDGFERTNAAHSRLLRFETQLRNFIDERMTVTFGKDWIKHHVPGDIRERWHEKKNKASNNGEREWPLLAYADFTDYVPLITRKDNWEAVFSSFFRREEFVRESFQRLYPIRICTMHARLITQDDELYLYVETKRVLEAIGIIV